MFTPCVRSIATRDRHEFSAFRFQDYEVLNLLGKGGYGSVYRAKCLRSGMEVAIKMVLYVHLFFNKN